MNTKSLGSGFISPETKAELSAIQKYHTETHRKIDKLGKKLLKDGYMKYENTPAISSWDQMVKMLIDEYWRSTERQDEQELINTFEQEAS
jgi:hypothetical protein